MLEMTNLSSIKAELSRNSITQIVLGKDDVLSFVAYDNKPLLEFYTIYKSVTGDELCDSDFLDKYGNIAVSLPYFDNNDGTLTVFVRLKFNALIKEFDRFKLLTVSAFEAIAIEFNNTIIDCNEEYVNVFEYKSKTEAIGKSSIKNLNLDNSFYETIVKHDSIESYECDAITEKGKLITIEVQRKPIQLPQGMGKRVSIKDVSKRQKISKELHTQHAIYEAVFQTKKSLLCVFNFENKITNISIGLSDLLKVEAKNAFNKNLEDIVTVDDIFADAHNLNKLYQNNGTPQLNLLPGEKYFTGVLKCKNQLGQSKILDVALSVLSDNHAYAYLLNVVDITELHSTIDNLYAKEKELTQTLMSSRLAGWSYNMETRLIHFSEEAVRSFGLPTTMSFESFIMSLHSDDQFKTANAFLPALTGGSFKTDTRLLLNDILYHIHIQGFSSKKKGEKDMYLNGFFQDISEHKAQEYELKAAKRKAESATEAKNVFLANMSHEIRTPLNSILGFSQLLEQKLVNPEYKKYISHIKNSGDILMRLISEVLDFSKLEANKIELHLDSFSLNEFANYHKNFFSQLVEEKQIEFNFEYESSKDVYVIGDMQRINQILINLVGNAIKFTDVGTVSLKIAYKINNGKGDLSLVIKDTGIGISKAGLNKIFSPFTQEESSTSKRFGGTGLGLSIVKNLIDKMGGTIDVGSEKGVGTEFKVIIPLAKAENQNPEVIANFEQIKNIDKLHILVAEDNPTNQLLIKAILNDFGLKYEIANNGQEALDILETVKGINLGIFDIQMPVMDGKTAVKQLRRYPNKYPQIPVIALTADATEQEKKAALKLGFNYFLTKPLKITEFHDTIGKFANIALDPKTEKKLSISKKEGKKGKEKTWGVQLDYIKEVTANDKNIIKELLISTERDFKKRLVLLEAAKNNLDAIEFKAALHAIKGSLTMFMDQPSCDRIAHFYKSFSPENIENLDFEFRAEEIIRHLTDINPLIEDLQNQYA